MIHFIQGKTQSTPYYNDNIEASMMDGNTVGNWRALRIINNTDSLTYVERYKLGLNLNHQRIHGMILYM